MTPDRVASRSTASESSNSHVVVTGGSGFIGSTVVRAFREARYPVTVVDRVPSRRDDVRMIVGDLRDRDVRDRALCQGVAGIIHLAAMTSVVGSIGDPTGVFHDNVVVTSDLLEHARARGISRFVLASTNAVVGEVSERVIDERAPLRPLTPYGATKAAAEMLVAAYGGSYDMTACSLRLTNVYGCGMRTKDSFVARLMRAARSRSGVQVYGDGLQRRDFVHVTDVAAALLLAWRGVWEGTRVVGHGQSSTVLDLVDSVRRVTGVPIAVEHVAPRRGEMVAVEVDISEARRQGYEPAIGLDEGLASLWDEVVSEWGDEAG